MAAQLVAGDLPACHLSSDITYVDSCSGHILSWKSRKVPFRGASRCCVFSHYLLGWQLSPSTCSCSCFWSSHRPADAPRYPSLLTFASPVRPPPPSRVLRLHLLSLFDMAYPGSSLIVAALCLYVQCSRAVPLPVRSTVCTQTDARCRLVGLTSPITSPLAMHCLWRKLRL